MDSTFDAALDRLPSYPFDDHETTLAPSSAGIGRRLNIARLTEIRIIIKRMFENPVAETCVIIVIVVIGPPISSMEPFPPIRSKSDFQIYPPARRQYGALSTKASPIPVLTVVCVIAIPSP